MSRAAVGVLVVLMFAAAFPCSAVVEATEQRWLLISNPRLGDVPSDVEYIWVEEDQVPTTLKTLIRGKRSLVAPPEIAAKYCPPPRGGKIGPRQSLPCPIVHPVTGEVLGMLDDPCACSSD